MAEAELLAARRYSMYNVTVKKNRPIEYLVIHYTAGTSSKGGTAKRIANYFGKQDTKASADFIVDQDEVIQFNPDIRNQYCWAVGDKLYKTFSTTLGGTLYKTARNANCVSIEMCSDKKNTKSLKVTDTDWSISDKVVERTALLAKKLMEEYDIPLDHVIMHHCISGKQCPQPWVRNEECLSNWYDFLKIIGKETLPMNPLYSAMTKANLNCREAPIVGDVVKTYENDTQIGIYAERRGWGRTTDGWVSLNYVERI